MEKNNNNRKNTNNPRRKNNPKRPPQRSNMISNLLMLVFVAIAGFGIYFAATSSNDAPTEYSYTEFIEKINKTEIDTVVSEPISGALNTNAYTINGKTSNGDSYYVYVPNETSLDTITDTIELVNLNNQADISYSHEPGNTYNFWNILYILVPVILLIVIVFFMIKGNGGGASKAFDFGKSRARLHKGRTTTFNEVAGCDEEKFEMEELIDFLKTPQKYISMGARIPKGVLLVGPPGTGKTLLARAVAGEAGVPFYSISGSDFVEMFVGVGASRVRDMFKTAKQNSPCIVFIDEIDAVGRQRGAGLGGGNDEREQTLNQLLVEMDGFGHNSGVIVIAATNRPDVLDPAILRPGRFDRQITISNPDAKGREAILKVHARNKVINPKITFHEISRRTPGFSGADLENLLNEAALLAARESKKQIELYHIDEAVDRVMMGPAKKSRKFSKRERDFVANHEAGHAVIGIKVDNANVVHKVTIIPRGQAGGYNLMLPEKEENFLKTKTSLIAEITGLLGGRVAEEIVFNEVTTGAYDDFRRATAIARAMVTEYGMSKLGPLQYERKDGNVFLGRDYVKDKNFSDQVALEIDKEVREIIQNCYEEATKVITENRDLLDLIAYYLLEVDTLTKEDIYEIVETKHLAWWDKKVKEANEVKITESEDKVSH